MIRPGLVLVAAMTRDRAIGKDGGMPWHLPADLKHFKSVTLGHPVIMGRKTFESIGKPLPGRTNVVVSRGNPELPDGVLLAESLEAAIGHFDEHEPIMVIGGGSIYEMALPLASVMELTFVDAQLDADTWFPAWPAGEWQLRAMRVRPADDDNPYRLSFCTFRRAKQP